MTHGSLFSGIGGFDLAAEWMGWDNLFHCEFNPFCQKILKYYWPNSKSYGDITKSTFIEFRGRIDILTGGFPCQPFSTAGKRKGTDDSRYLWPEMLRVIREVQPRYIVGENVRGLVSWDGGLVFDTVCSDLEAEGYEVLPVLLPAAGVNAPHKRDRIWFVAYSKSARTWSDIGGIRSVSKRCDSRKKNATFIAHFNNKGGSSGFGQVQEENGEVSERNNDAEFSDSSNRDATDTISIGHRGITEETRNNSSEQFRWLVSDIGHNGDEVRSKIERCSKNASNTNSEMLEYRNGEREAGKSTNKEERIESFGSPRKWETFPTVSPICNGNDGLPDRLDSITFSKWRNESIKGGGNAIVPQVALEIFKVIQKIEENEYRKNSQS